MKKIKKLLLLTLACLTVFTMGAVSACGDDDNDNGDSGNNTEQGGNTDDGETPDEPDPVEYVYKVRAQSEGGFGLKDVNVALYDGETKLVSVNTNAEGNAFFTEEHVSTLGNYRIEFTNVPKGWSVKEDTITYQTSTVSGSNVNVNFAASLITDERIPETKVYRLGDVMYDFEVTAATGNKYRLSEVLQSKKMVLINFWASWCGPCQSEFPAMKTAYTAYSSDVEIFAVTIDSSDTAAKINKDYDFNFPAIGHPDNGVITSHFNTSGGIPMTVVIDRYGVVSSIHTGSMVAVSDFENLFNKFIGDDYVQTVVSGESGEGGDAEVLEWATPDVSNPNIEDVKAAFAGNDDTFTFSWEDDNKSWPWQIGTDASGSYLAASNKQVDYSYATLNIDFTAAANTTLAFDYSISTEADADHLYVMLDGTVIHDLSGLQTAWTTCHAYVFEQAQAGEHRLTLIYMKDASDSADDIVYVKNLRFLSNTELPNQSMDLNILRHASSNWNNPANHNDGDAKTTKFQNYVNVKLGADGYYHVIPNDASADYEVNLDTDPMLFADIMNGTHWNKFDLWQLAYNGLLVYNGFNLEDVVEQFAWAATNAVKSTYVPVTPDLKELLDILAQLDDVYGQSKDENDNATRVNYFDKNAHVAYHENEWLEMCIYYDHYGDTPPIGDTTRGITYEGAIEIFEGKNTIDCFKSIVPVGIKHKFTPTKSGVYHFYSTVDAENFDTAETYNPQMWLVDSDKKTFLAENADFLIHHTKNPENFDIKYYLEAGQTYYCLFAFFLNSTGTFDMQIDYLGTYYPSLTNCAVGPYTMNMVTSETYVPGAQNVLYDAENDVYRVADRNGVFLGDLYEGLDDKVYWDLTHPTFLFPSDPLKTIIDSYTKYEQTKRLFYLNDENGNKKDYSEIMSTYLFLASLNNKELNGMIAVNGELMHIMLQLTKSHDGFGGVKNSWQMMCYYYQPLGQK